MRSAVKRQFWFEGGVFRTWVDLELRHRGTGSERTSDHARLKEVPPNMISQNQNGRAVVYEGSGRGRSRFFKRSASLGAVCQGHRSAACQATPGLKTRWVLCPAPSFFPAGCSDDFKKTKTGNGVVPWERKIGPPRGGPKLEQRGSAQPFQGSSALPP